MSNCLCQNTNIIWLIRITFQMQSLLLLYFIFHFLIFKLHQSSSSSLCVYNFFRVIPSWFKKTKRKFFRENVKFDLQTSLVPTPSLLEDEIDPSPLHRVWRNPRTTITTNTSQWTLQSGPNSPSYSSSSLPQAWERRSRCFTWTWNGWDPRRSCLKMNTEMNKFHARKFSVLRTMQL